jgi:predicted metal-dependent peptidase
MSNDEPEKKIAKARLKLIFDYPFFGHLSLSLEPKRADNLFPPTMATDGFRLYYHPEFIKETQPNHLSAIIAHEVWHIASLHLTRRQTRNPMKWNFACDYAVNDIIRGEGLELPPGHLYNPDYHGKSAEWIYSQLPEFPEENGEGQGEGEGEGEGDGNGGLIDSHEPWKDWDKGKNDDGYGNEITKEQLESRIRENVASAAVAARMAGALSANVAEKVEGILQPKLDWKSILRDMVVSTAHNNFRLVPSSKKHLWRNIYLPATTGHEISIAAVIDTSGSISSDEMKEFLAEIEGICSAFDEYTIYLFACDMKIQQRWELHSEDEVPRLLSGRGGTSFRPALEAIQKEQLDISAVIYLTDLYPNDGYPEMPDIPVIWVSVSPPEVKPPWGELINIDRRGNE